jgi:hypothetical protein
MRKGEYLEKLKRRTAESHVYKKYQLFGLEVAKTLGDEKHKSLYIKLAKEGNAEKLLRLAKEIAERRGIKNMGAYFMATLANAKNAGKMPNKHAAKRSGRFP